MIREDVREQQQVGEEVEPEIILLNTRCTCVMPIRYVVVILGLVGCMLDYLMRFGLSVAIIAMTNATSAATSNDTIENACPAALNDSNYVPVPEGEFAWTVQEQGLILGTFFWGYFFTKTIGGRIGEVVGGRETMAVSIGVSGVLCLLSPTMAAIHPLALALLRFIMGLFQGPAFPSLYCLLVRWAPPNQLATMSTIAFSGMALGSLVAMGCSEWVIDHMGWKWVFWGSGFLGLLWTPIWIYFVRNSPCSHPHITREEKDLLAPNLVNKPRRVVPWGRLLRCWRLYPAILAEFASTWLSNQTTNQGPTFLNDQVGFRLDETSLVLTSGQASAWVMSLVFGRLSDRLVNAGHLQKVNVRRLIHFVGTVVVVVGLTVLVLSGCNKWGVAIMMIVTMIGASTNYSTYTLTPMDIAPNYAGTLSGLIGLGTIGGFVAPLITAEIVAQTGGWESSMLLCGGVYLLIGFLFILSLTADVQDWNDYEQLLSSDEEDH